MIRNKIGDDPYISGSVISAKRVSIGYRSASPVVRNISVEYRLPAGRDGRARQGGMLGFAGPNGAGKTTFLKTCLGLIPPLGGELRLFGVETRSLCFSGIRKKMAYVPQNRPTGGSDRVRISVREAVSFGRLGKLGLLGSLGRRDKIAIGEAIERCGLGNLVDVAVQDLSGGQYQRVAIARAMAAEPELYLFDEPGSFLDAEGQAAMRGFITSLAGSGSSMIVVTHDRGLLALCGAIIGFENGGASLLAREDFADGALGGGKGLNDERGAGS